ncbi:MAG: hypothetical protein SH818_14890 [Saprospiraceae bacterium]|nr:hypothetical protein [Saprospiraceae bacterium]
MIPKKSKLKETGYQDTHQDNNLVEKIIHCQPGYPGVFSNSPALGDMSQ